jgi:hypothetical protein
VQSNERLRNETGRQLDDIPQGQLITCDPADLRPHPAYREVCGDPSESKLLALSQYSALWQEPLIVTADRSILDGHARRVIAIRQKRAGVICIQYDLAGPEALRFILNRHREASGLNPYCRVLLALQLEPFFQARIRCRLRETGAPSNLTEAERIDVRSEIAHAAGVSAGNVTKVKQILKSCVPEIRLALRQGDVRIHRAWKWSRLSATEQRQALSQHTNHKGIGKIVSRLIRQHARPNDAACPTIAEITQWMNRVTRAV